MVLLQAMMAASFILVGLFVFLLIFLFIFIPLFNVFQPRLYPENPKYIPWYWIIILPILIIGIIITIFCLLPDQAFIYT